jgi:hypothetical protein
MKEMRHWQEGGKADQITSFHGAEPKRLKNKAWRGAQKVSPGCVVVSAKGAVRT